MMVSITAICLRDYCSGTIVPLQKVLLGDSLDGEPMLGSTV